MTSDQHILLNFRKFGLILLATGFPIFLAVTLSILATEGRATSLDQLLVDLLRAVFNWMPDWLNRFIRSVGYFSFFVSLSMGIFLPFYWLWKRRFRNAFLIFFSTWGSFSIWAFLLYAFDRVRPQPIIAGELPGYPSGHALSMFTIYGLLFYIFYTQINRRGWTRITFFAWMIWSLLNGLSRLYLEQHLPTDVIAGYAFGAAWLGITFLFLPAPNQP
jgi:undecaprenyl-diphosphatase